MGELRQDTGSCTERLRRHDAETPGGVVPQLPATAHTSTLQRRLVCDPAMWILLTLSHERDYGTKGEA